jgi:hypothetical protein
MDATIFTEFFETEYENRYNILSDLMMKNHDISREDFSNFEFKLVCVLMKYPPHLAGEQVDTDRVNSQSESSVRKFLNRMRRITRDFLTVLTLSTQWCTTTFGYIHQRMITTNTLLLTSTKMMAVLHQVINRDIDPADIIYKDSKTSTNSNKIVYNVILLFVVEILSQADGRWKSRIGRILPHCTMIIFANYGAPASNSKHVLEFIETLPEGSNFYDTVMKPCIEANMDNGNRLESTVNIINIRVNDTWFHYRTAEPKDSFKRVEIGYLASDSNSMTGLTFSRNPTAYFNTIVDSLTSTRLTGYHVVRLNHWMFSGIEHSIHDEWSGYDMDAANVVSLEKHVAMQAIFYYISCYEPELTRCYFVGLSILGLSMARVDRSNYVAQAGIFKEIITFFQYRLNIFCDCAVLRYNEVDTIIKCMISDGVPRDEDLFYVTILMIYLNRFDVMVPAFVRGNEVHTTLDAMYKSSFLSSVKYSPSTQRHRYMENQTAFRSISARKMSVSDLMTIMRTIFDRVRGRFPETMDHSASFSLYNYSLFLSSIGVGNFNYNVRWIVGITSRPEEYAGVTFHQVDLCYDPHTSTVVTWMEDSRGAIIYIETDAEEYSRTISEELTKIMIQSGRPDDIDYYVIIKCIFDEAVRYLCCEQTPRNNADPATGEYVTILGNLDVGPRLRLHEMAKFLTMTVMCISGGNGGLSDKVERLTANLDEYMISIREILLEAIHTPNVRGIIYGISRFVVNQRIVSLTQMRGFLNSCFIHMVVSEVQRIHVIYNNAASMTDDLFNQSSTDIYAILDSFNTRHVGMKPFPGINSRYSFLVLGHLIEETTFIATSRFEYKRTLAVGDHIEPRAPLKVIFDRASNLGSFVVPHSRWFKMLMSTDLYSAERDILILVVMHVTTGLTMTNSPRFAYLDMINSMIDKANVNHNLLYPYACDTDRDHRENIPSDVELD